MLPALGCELRGRGPGSRQWELANERNAAAPALSLLTFPTPALSRALPRQALLIQCLSQSKRGGARTSMTRHCLVPTCVLPAALSTSGVLVTTGKGLNNRWCRQVTTLLLL